MALMSPSALLKHVRSSAGQGGLRDLPPIVLSIDLAPGVNPDDPDLFYTPSMTVSPMVHPTLAALLDHHGATRRGRASWQVGYGEDTPQGAIGALLDGARSGTVWWKSDLLARTKPRSIIAEATKQNRSRWNDIRRHRTVGHFFTEDRASRFWGVNRYLQQAPQ